LPSPSKSWVSKVTTKRPTLLAAGSVNHSAPSGLGVMPLGTLPAVGTGNSVIKPAVVMRPILLPCCSVNHRLPSGPGVMLLGRLLAVGIGNSLVITPAVVMRPILFAVFRLVVREQKQTQTNATKTDAKRVPVACVRSP